MIPLFMKIHLQEKGRKKTRLCIPLFLLWFLLFVFLAALAPLLVIAGIVAWVRGYQKEFFFAVPMLISVLWSLSGLRIHIEHDNKIIRLVAN